MNNNNNNSNRDSNSNSNNSQINITAVPTAAADMWLYRWGGLSHSEKFQSCEVSNRIRFVNLDAIPCARICLAPGRCALDDIQNYHSHVTWLS